MPGITYTLSPIGVILTLLRLGLLDVDAFFFDDDAVVGRDLGGIPIDLCITKDKQWFCPLHMAAASVVLVMLVYDATVDMAVHVDRQANNGRPIKAENAWTRR